MQPLMSLLFHSWVLCLPLLMKRWIFWILRNLFQLFFHRNLLPRSLTQLATKCSLCPNHHLSDAYQQPPTVSFPTNQQHASPSVPATSFLAAPIASPVLVAPSSSTISTLPETSTPLPPSTPEFSSVSTHPMVTRSRAGIFKPKHQVDLTYLGKMPFFRLFLPPKSLVVLNPLLKILVGCPPWKKK